MAKVPNFSAGDPVTVDVSERGLVIKPVNRRREPLIYTESELLADLTPEKAHTDELARLTDIEESEGQEDFARPNLHVP